MTAAAFHPDSSSFADRLDGSKPTGLPARWTVRHWMMALVPGTFFAVTNFAQNAFITGGFAAWLECVLVFALFLVTYNFIALVLRAGWRLPALTLRWGNLNWKALYAHAAILFGAGLVQLYGIAVVTAIVREAGGWSASVGHYFFEIVVSCGPVWILVYVTACIALRWVTVREGKKATQAPGTRMEFRDSGKIKYVDIAEITLVEAQGNYVRIVTSDRSLMPRLSISEMESALPDSGFVRTHRSTIVRKTMIAEIRRSESGAYTAVLEDGRVAPVSRRRLFAVRGVLSAGGR